MKKILGSLCNVKRENRRYYTFAVPLLFCMGYLFYHNLPACFLLTLAAYPGKRIHRIFLADRKQREISDQFRDLLYSFSSSFSTSRQLAEALEEAMPRLAVMHGKDAVLTVEVFAMVKKLRESGDTEERILMGFAEKCANPDIQSFVDVYIICRKSGGDLMKVIGKTIVVLLDKLDIDREIRKITAQKRYESLVIGCIPLLMLFFLQFASPDYLAVMYQTPAGRILMSLALLGTAVSCAWSFHITRIRF